MKIKFVAYDPHDEYYLSPGVYDMEAFNLIKETFKRVDKHYFFWHPDNQRFELCTIVHIDTALRDGQAYAVALIDRFGAFDVDEGREDDKLLFLSKALNHAYEGCLKYLRDYE